MLSIVGLFKIAEKRNIDIDVDIDIDETKISK